MTTTEHKPTLWLALTAVVIGVATTIGGLVASVLGLLGDSASASGMVVTGTVIRTVLSLLVVALVIWFAASRAGGSVGAWLGAAAAGYLLDLFAWGGNALFTATLLGGAQDQPLWARLIGFVVDLGLWLVVARFAAARGLAVERPVDVSSLG